MGSEKVPFFFDYSYPRRESADIIRANGTDLAVQLEESLEGKKRQIEESLLKRGSPLQSVISPSFTGFHSFLSLAGLSTGRAAKCVSILLLGRT